MALRGERNGRPAGNYSPFNSPPRPRASRTGNFLAATRASRIRVSGLPATLVPCAPQSVNGASSGMGVSSRLTIDGTVVMVINELTREASLEFLARAYLGRLACAQGDQPYVVPINFVYHHTYLYSFSTVGKKIEWMRSNPLVSVEVDEIVSSQQWVSVIGFGRYEELPDTPRWSGERIRAGELLQQKAMWWEPGFAKTILHGIERPLVPVFYRIYIASITGHRATP
jgi:nitroimidazol reductase NimA-like FMN-containing flavoprotein (pyridoxamine 5'-phosphate oxidase superfamily)